MKKKILIIEDDKDTLKVYLDRFKMEGFDVITSQTGEGALEHILDKKPDLVLLDIMLTGKLNGFDVLEKIKGDKDLKKTPVIILTNLGSEEGVAKEIGAEDYFIKANSDLEDVVIRVKEVLSS